MSFTDTSIIIFLESSFSLDRKWIKDNNYPSDLKQNIFKYYILTVILRKELEETTTNVLWKINTTYNIKKIITKILAYMEIW